MSRLDAVIPIVNYNGTSAEALIDQQREIVHAAKALQRALMAAQPHGRDYQYNGPDDFAGAQDNYFQMTGYVAAIEDHAITVGLAIMHQKEKV